MLNALLPAAQSVAAQVINGAPLRYNWDHGADAQGVNARAVLPSRDYGTLILTEAVPLRGHVQWSNTSGVARDYAALAWGARADARVLIYETWGELGNAAAWRASLSADRTVWQGIADHVNAAKPGAAPVVGLVAGGQAMALLYDSVAAGRGEGLTHINQIFADTIHLNNTGNYMIALLQAATITGSSGVGLTDSLYGEWGERFGGWTTDQTVLLQHVAWEAAATAPGALLAKGTILPQVMLGASRNETLTAGNGDDRLYGNRGNDLINGLNGQDLLSGEHGNDLLYGGNGNDLLLGGAGKDALYGGAGNDRLHGQAANDVLTGGTGADDFVFSRGGGADRVADFSLRQSDQLMLDDALWTGRLSTAQVVTQFARVTPEGVLFDFGKSGSLLLQGVTTTAGLSAAIEIF